MMEWLRRLQRPRQPKQTLALALGQECVLLVQRQPSVLFVREPCRDLVSGPEPLPVC